MEVVSPFHLILYHYKKLKILLWDIDKYKLYYYDGISNTKYLAR